MVRRFSAISTLLALAVASVCLAGCGSGTMSLASVSIQSAWDANANGAVAIDVVLADGGGLDEILGKLSAAEWFRRRAQFQRDHPDDVSVLSWELVPGQSISVPVGREAASIYVFAGYATPGDHRARLRQDQADVRITLEANDFTVQNAGATD